MDPFLSAAIEEAEAGLAEGGIPIGSVLVHAGRIVGRGHNRRVQGGSAILHAEMDALEERNRAAAHPVARQPFVLRQVSRAAKGLAAPRRSMHAVVRRVRNKAGW